MHILDTCPSPPRKCLITTVFNRSTVQVRENVLLLLHVLDSCPPGTGLQTVQPCMTHQSTVTHVETLHLKGCCICQVNPYIQITIGDLGEGTETEWTVVDAFKTGFIHKNPFKIHKLFTKPGTEKQHENMQLFNTSGKGAHPLL